MDNCESIVGCLFYEALFLATKQKQKEKKSFYE